MILCNYCAILLFFDFSGYTGYFKNPVPPLCIVSTCIMYPWVQAKTPKICKIPGVLWPAIYGRLVSFTEIFNQILNESNPNDLSLAPIQKLLLNSVSERDISAQETCHLLLGLPLYHSSWTFISLNLNEVGPRWIRGTGSGPNGEELFTNDAGRTNQSPLEKYWNRSDDLEDLSLFKTYLTYKYVNHYWKKCGDENIVRVWPQPSGLRNGPQWEEFCRIKVLLHILHRSIIQLNESNLPWSTIYYQHIDTINKDPIDLLGKPVDNKEQLSDDESEGELLEDEEQEEFWFDWMHLAEMGPNMHINSTSDLGSRDMDRNHDWINEPKTHYSVTDLETIGDFVQRASNNTRNSNIEEEYESIEYQNLNKNQKKVFDRIETHYNKILTCNQVEPLRILVMSTAGIGKSYLISAIRGLLRRMAGVGSKI